MNWFEDIQFSISIVEEEYWVTFFLFEQDMTEVYLHGVIKWDGCANWFFDKQDNGGAGFYLHTCDKAGIERISAAMLRCYEIASVLIYFEGEI